MISCSKCKKATLPLVEGGCIKTGGIVDVGCEHGEPRTLTNYDQLIHKSPEELADLIFFELAQFPDRASLLAYLKQDAKEEST